MSLRLTQHYLTEHTELTEKNNLNFMNPSAASYLLIYGRPGLFRNIIDKGKNVYQYLQ